MRRGSHGPSGTHERTASGAGSVDAEGTLGRRADGCRWRTRRIGVRNLRHMLEGGYYSERRPKNRTALEDEAA